MKILLLSLLILTNPIHNVILKSQNTPIIIKKQKQQRKLWQSRSLYASTTTSTFNLFYVALVMFLFLSGTPRWALFLFSVPILLKLIRTVFTDHHHESGYRKLLLNKKKSKRMVRHVRKMKEKGITMEKEKQHIMRFLQVNHLLQRRKVKQEDLMGIISKYYSEVKGMHGRDMSSQISMVVSQLFKNKGNILSLIQSFM